jgi:hypothetical protein
MNKLLSKKKLSTIMSNLSGQMTKKTRKRLSAAARKRRRKVQAAEIAVLVDEGSIPRYIPGCPGCPPIERIRELEPDNPYLPENKRNDGDPDLPRTSNG